MPLVYLGFRDMESKAVTAAGPLEGRLIGMLNPVEGELMAWPLRPKVLRRVGPQRAVDLGLRGQVETTDARNIHLS
jgi:hypothetical protein